MSGRSFTESDDFHNDRRFEGFSFVDADIRGYTFENCVFRNCDFHRISLVNVSLNGCRFEDSRFIPSGTANLSLNGTVFFETRVAAVDFSSCASFGFSPEFHSCVLENCGFADINLKSLIFAGSRLKSVDFLECDLTASDFTDSRFEDVSFRNCRLEQADFRRAAGYRIDPFINRLTGARFDFPEAVSFLGFLDISLE